MRFPGCSRPRRRPPEAAPGTKAPAALYRVHMGGGPTRGDAASGVLERTEEGKRARPSLPLWAREPVVLARFPGVLSAVLGASLVLALIAGAGPLFVSSAANSALQEAL